jgi:hypothetical protein
LCYKRGGDSLRDPLTQFVTMGVQILHDAAGDTLLAGRVGIVNQGHLASWLMPQLPARIVLKHSETVGGRRREQKTAHALRLAILADDQSEGQEEPQLRAEQQQLEKPCGETPLGPPGDS